MKQKKIPMRRCCGCNEQKPKKELVRVVKAPDGEVFVDFTGKASGRGAYICNDSDCLKKAAKSRRIDRVFGITIPDSVYEHMEETIKGNDDR